jgi:hypothetical protein
MSKDCEEYLKNIGVRNWRRKSRDREERRRILEITRSRREEEDFGKG